NMFALPISTWFTGGIFHEHTHRLWASWVGVLVVALTRWVGGSPSRQPLAIIGIAEVVAGMLLLRLGADWKGAGHFLSGIGSVVLLAGIVWVKNKAFAWPLPILGWWAFALVQVQGLLGGLRVVLDAQVVADVRLGTAFGILHACLGQAFLVLLCAIALMTSRWWMERRVPTLRDENLLNCAELELRARLRPLFLATTILIFLQLLIAATMRHQHAGLAIPDFPLAYGELWPDMSTEAVARYNALRSETAGENMITSFQIIFQMVHRGMAVLILAGVTACAWRAKKSPLARLANFWLGLILVQIALGAWTIWSNKAADVATVHVLAGALSLVTGVLGCLICFRRSPQDARSSVAAFSEAASVPGVSA